MTAVFFDLDGCLVDSRDAIAASINRALGYVGLPEQDEANLHRYIGPPLAGTFATLLAEHGLQAGLVDTCVAVYRDDYRATSAARTRAVPGIGRSLAHLQGRCTTAVVTSKPRELAEPLLAALDLDHWFTAVHGPSLDALTETKTATLRRALQSSGYDPAACNARGATAPKAWMVGDRHHDVEAGRACGIGTVGVTWGIGDRRELEDAGASVIVDTLDELDTHLMAATWAPGP